ncbi:MAG: RluA family pseudouridine synthase [Treponemataceae bacterium]|nr:RluA family pseudouridine synthase [Treponemataceae bacterium]
MFPPFPQEQSKIECLKLMEELDKGLLDSFLKDSPGQMFGVAVCIERKNFAFGDPIIPSPPIEEMNPENFIVLRAFSGQLAGQGRWNYPGFVPPCIDVEKWNEEVKRADPGIKAETAKIQELEELYEKASSEEKKEVEKTILEQKALRKNLSHESLRNIYGFYEFTCFDGHVETYASLSGNSDDPDSVFQIPTGTGDCCAPKLINYAYKNGLQIVSMAEFFYGNEPKSGLKKHKEFYPPCDEKCGLLLPKMLGLNILYRDKDIIVVNKQDGILSAPGKGDEKFDCIPYRVRLLVPDCIEQPCVHRLDMDTSGILVLGLNKKSHRNLSIQFQDRKTEKFYRALLRGKLSDRTDQKSGTISFPMRVDLENRPYQIYDEEYGRMAVSDWKVLDEYEVPSENLNMEEKKYSHWRTLIEYKPQTGRTHQLRLHSAHEKGLGLAIVGDRLYGQNLAGERLCLQAYHLSFFHPVTEEKMTFEVEPEF